MRLSANSDLGRGPEGMPRVLAIEILAQAAILLLPDLAGAGRGLLAGVDDASLQAPLLPGDTLSARIEVVGKFGALVKVRGTLAGDDGHEVASTTLMLARA